MIIEHFLKQFFGYFWNGELGLELLFGFVGVVGFAIEVAEEVGAFEATGETEVDLFVKD